MRVVILGAGTSIPAKGYSPAGIYVDVGGEHLLFDAGPGTLQRLQAIGISFQQIDRLFLTHYHVDHCLDLISLLFAWHIPRPMRRRPLTIYGPPGLARLHRQLNTAFHRWLEPRGCRLRIRELDEARIRCPGYVVYSRWMRHSASALGYRLEAEGKSMAYSGDTDVCEAVIALGKDADLFILECSMPDEQKTAGHLTPMECGQIARRADCRHLALTHFYPLFRRRSDIRTSVRKCFQGRLTLARDLTRLVLASS